MSRVLLSSEVAALCRPAARADVPAIPPVSSDRDGRADHAAVVRALGAAAADAILVLAPQDEGGDDRCAALADLAGLAWIRLGEPLAASAAMLAAILDMPGGLGRRELEVVAGLAPTDGGPAGRPAVIARWAAGAWRPCGWCPAGGPPAGRCGRCGARVDAS